MELVLSSGILLIICLLTLRCQAFTVKEILVHEPVTFLCTCSRNCSQVLWTRFIPVKAVVAKCRSRACQIEQHCLKRFAVSGDTSRGNFSMRISRAAYNDAGSYMCTCDGVPVTEVKLKVYVPTVVEVFAGQSVTLPCYGNTRQGVKDVAWMKAGRRFLLYVHENRSVTTEEASASRVMISTEGFLDGDLSLHISSAQQSDAGVYQCLLNNEAQEGEPRAVLLKVKGPQLFTTTSSNAVTVLAVLLCLLVFAGLIGAIIYIVRRRARPHTHTHTH